MEASSGRVQDSWTNVDSSKRGIKPGLTIKLELPADGVTGKRSCAAEQPASSDNQEHRPIMGGDFEISRACR